MFIKRISLIWIVLLLLLSPPTYGQVKPNIILINLDDATANMFETKSADQQFPNIMSIAKSGIQFTNMHVTTPLCGPSRACLYRGQYAHHTGIRVNNTNAKTRAHGLDGGFRYYREHGYFEDDLGIWMKNAGYRTMMIGKYLHGEVEWLIPPGWDDYYFSLGAKYFDTYRFTNRISERGKTEKNAAGIYRTNVETDDAVRLIRAHVKKNSSQPFFLNLNPLGPHREQPNTPGMVDEKYLDLWREATMPPSLAYNEQDNQDKRGFFKSLPKLNPGWERNLKEHYRERLLATLSVDDMVGAIQETLVQLKIDQQTYIFVTSDNGFLMGHYRVYGKGLPVDRVSRVPLFVKGPKIQANQTASHLLGHIDLAPTIVALAEGHTPAFVDGQSFAKLLLDPKSSKPKSWRDGLLIENWEPAGSPASLIPSIALRTYDTIYTEWANGEFDYFDLSTDPEQLENTYDSLSQREQADLRRRLLALTQSKAKPYALLTSSLSKIRAGQTDTVLSGIAECWDGIGEVELVIENRDTKKYWNGEKWQTKKTHISAEVENRDGIISNWKYSFPVEHLPRSLKKLKVNATAEKSTEIASPSDAEEGRIRRHADFYWHDRFLGFVVSSYHPEGAWEPCKEIIHRGKGNLVLLDFGTYDTHTVDGIESTKIQIQLPYEVSVGDQIQLRPFAPQSENPKAIEKSDDVYLMMQPGEIAASWFTNPVLRVMKSKAAGDVGFCKILSMTPEAVTIHLKLSADVEIDELEIDRTFKLIRRKPVIIDHYLEED